MTKLLIVAATSAMIFFSGCSLGANETPVLRETVQREHVQREQVISSLSELELLPQIVSAQRLSGAEAADSSRFFFPHYLPGDLDHLVVYEIVYKTPDGAFLRGFVSAPADYLENTYPVIIRSNPEGYGRHGGTDWFGLRKGVRLTEEGFIVIQFRHRHDLANRAEEYDLYGTMFLANVEGGIPSQFGGNDLYDITTLIEISEHFGFSADKRFLKGDMRAYILLRREDLVDAAIIYRAIPDFEAYYMELVEEIEFLGELGREANQPQAVIDAVIDAMVRPHYTHLERIRSALGGSPGQARDEFFNRSAIRWADEITTPLLFIQNEGSFLFDTYGVYGRMSRAGRDVTMVYNTVIRTGEIDEEMFADIVYWLNMRTFNN